MPHRLVLAVVLCGVLAGSLQAEEKRARAAVQAQVTTLRQAGQGLDVPVRQEVDPNDNRERLLLLAPGGPLIVELTIASDGQPFRLAREKLIDELASAADADGDGKAAWSEAFGNRRFGLGRFNVGQNPQQLTQTIGNFDVNRNGLVERAELRRYLAISYGGDAFALLPGGGNFPQADLRDVLDANQDGQLDEAELLAAAEKLKARDANDNDWLDVGELVPLARAYTQPAAGADVQILLLGPAANLVTVFEALQKKYGVALSPAPTPSVNIRISADSFRAVPALFARLDLDKNQQLDAGEVIGLQIAPPHLELAVRLGASGGEPAGVSVTRVAAEVGGENILKATPQGPELLLPGMTVRWLAGEAAGSNGGRTDFGPTARNFLMQFDKDKNGYITKDELADNAQAQFARQQFDQWDADENGKVFPGEIVAFFERQQAPIQTQVKAVMSQQSASFFTPLDADGDGRLSLREMRQADARLRTLDKDGDQRITLAEVPAKLTIAFGRGNAAYNSVAVAGGGFGVVTQQAPRPRQGPSWYVRMDKNGDGDVTQREFLGSPARFAEFDKDGDGFLDRSEAEAVKP